MGSFGCHLSLSLSLSRSLSMCVSVCFSHFNLTSSPHFPSPLPLPLPLTLPPSLHSPILLLFSFLQSIVILLLGNCSVYPSPQFRWTRLSQLLVSQPTSPHLTSPHCLTTTPICSSSFIQFWTIPRSDRLKDKQRKKRSRTKNRPLFACLFHLPANPVHSPPPSIKPLLLYSTFYHYQYPGMSLSLSLSCL